MTRARRKRSPSAPKGRVLAHRGGSIRGRAANPPRLGWLALLASAAALGLGACGSEEPGDAPEAKPLGQERAGSVAPLVQCRDWVTGDEPEKLATIADIRSQINLEDAPVEAPPLTDDEAMQLFDNACSESFASGFRLYVLYARAVGFVSLTR